MDQTKMSIVDKLPNYKKSHLLAVARELAVNFVQTNDRKISDVDYFMSLMERSFEKTIAHSIQSNFASQSIETAHNRVRARYQQGDRYYKKGRPMGSKNRNSNTNYNSDADALDALNELGNEEKALEMLGDDSDFMNNSNSGNTMADAKEIKQEIALLFKEFLDRYGKDIERIETEARHASNALRNELTAHMDARFEAMRPNIIEIKQDALPNLNMGVQHKQFATLLKMASARLRNGTHNNVWIYGPAGTGKSTAAELVAKALGLDYYTDGKMADETKVTGYKDANGTYHTTNFRKAFEFGGVYLADEIDGSMPDALLALNGALANGHCSFPDKIVARHKDFIFLAAANTTGTGGTIEYVGRFKQDAAFNDRFVFLHWPLDEALEESIIANKTWLTTVKTVRAKIATSTIRGHLITPRASIYGESLLAAGLDLEVVINSVLKKGLTDAQWNMVKP